MLTKFETMAEGGMKTAPADFEVIFKRHVHGNLILHGQKRGMDSMKKKKMQELDRDKELFKKQYSKYQLVNRPSTMTSPRYKRDQSSATPNPVFVVCKNSPCSFKTWNNMTDVSGRNLDIYKTDVLKTEEAEVSLETNEKRKQALFAERRKSFLQENLAVKNKRALPTAYVDSEKCDLTENLQAMPQTIRRRSLTMPEQELRQFRKRIESISNKLGTKQTIKSISAEEMTDDFDGQRCTSALPKIMTPICRENSVTLPDIKLIPTSASSYGRCSKHDEGHNNETKEEPDQQCNSSMYDQSELSKNDSMLSIDHTSVLTRRHSTVSQISHGSRENLPRLLRRCSNADSVVTTLTTDYVGLGDSQRPRLSSCNFENSFISENIVSLRPRSNTMDSALQKPLPRVSLKKGISEAILARRNSQKGLVGLETRQRRMSLFEKLLSTSRAESEEDFNASNSSEELRSCRYIRVPGEDINGSHEDISLEQMDFRHTSPLQEETSSCTAHETTDIL